MNGRTVIAFFGGVVIGAVGGIFATRKHFETIANEDIASAREMYEKRNKAENEPEESEESNDIQIKNEKPALNDYMSKLKEAGYKNYSNSKEPDKIPVEPDFSSKDIYTITDAEFGEEEGYEQLSYTYFYDNVLCDENNEPLSQNDILKTVGYDALENFDYEETDAVYVRNDILKTDYEILRDVREYKNVIEDRK